MMVEPWRWGLPWVVKGWVYWYRSRFAVMGVGLGLPPRVVGIVGCFFFFLFFWC